MRIAAVAADFTAHRPQSLVQEPVVTLDPVRTIPPVRWSTPGTATVIAGGQLEALSLMTRPRCRPAESDRPLEEPARGNRIAGRRHVSIDDPLDSGTVALVLTVDCSR